MQNGQPKYQKIIDDLLLRIQTGEYPESSKLPGENRISELYSVSVLTVRQALKELVYRKKIIRIKGKGTFVSSAESREMGAVKAAGELRGKKIICFITYLRNSNSTIMRIIRGAQSYLGEQGYQLMTMFGDAHENSERDLGLKALELGVAGVLLFAANPNENISTVKLLEDAGIQVVFLDRGTDSEPCALVSSNNTDGGYRMTKHLLECGHRNILYVSGHIKRTSEKDRVEGFRMAMRQAGYADGQLLILDEVHNHTAEVFEYIKNGVTAIQCVNDKTALGIIDILGAEGISVPKDVSVSGFDGIDEGKYNVPRLTTVMQPFEDMGREASEELLRMINGKKGYRQTYLQVELLVRDSTGHLDQ